MNIRFVLPLALALTAASLAAQAPLSLRGELDEGRSTGCYYCPNVPYTIRYSETPVRSNTVDLAFYKNLSAQLVLTGVWDTSTTPAGLQVSHVQVVSESLSLPNTARTGADMRVSAYAAPGSAVGIMIAFGNGFLPFLDTALLINPNGMFPLGSNVIDPTGQWRFDVPMPADANLIGLRFWSQAVVAAPGGLIYTSNPTRTLIDR